MNSGPMICSNCGCIGMPKRQKQGSAFVEKFLWWTLFFPGIFYSFWRNNSRADGCPRCGSNLLVKFDTPEGESIMKRHLKTVGKERL